jgi:drug/metabolite transporter (DMT)-like permease
MAVAFLGERLTWQGWFGTAAAFVGASIIASSAGVSLHMGSGVLMVVIATMIWASYQVVQKTVAAGYGPLELTAWPTWIASVALLPWTFGLPRAVAAAPLSASVAIVWLGAASSVAGFLAWSYAIKRLPVVVSSNALFAVPVAAFVIGWLVLGEAPAALALLGGAITIAGVTFAQTRGRVARAVVAEA